MNANQLLLLSVGVFGLGAFVCLLLNSSSRSARIVAGLIGMLGSAIGFISAVIAVVNNPGELVIPLPLPFGSFTMQMDILSAMMVGLITLVGFAASLYSISFLEKYENRSLGVLGFFTNAFIASMMMVVTTSNGFYFMLFWELMTVASYFLVIFDSKNKEAIQAGFLYMLIAHIGGMLIMISFFIFYLHTGSFAFNSFRQAGLPPALRNLVFLLAFVGFGAKAGVVPLHIWMPGSYAAAPPHATALMSSVMKKTAIYGILRVCVDFLGASVLWWGLLILFFGALSAVLGILFALVENDMKRMLAYSSVENVGIILLGIGVGMIGLAEEQPAVALVGFLAALYHVVNHSFFKSLLFLSAGSVENQLETRNLNRMGGLAKKMPWTGLAFLIGALAVSAIPPLNGFVSEWFTYQSLFSASSSPYFAVRIFAPLAAVLLALAGALAAMCFIKAFSSTFSGPPRNESAKQAIESPGGMLASLFYLAACCLLLGIGAPVVAPFLANVAASIPPIPNLQVASNMWVYPAETGQALLSTPLVAILLIGLISIPLLVVAAYNGFRPGRRTVEEPWATGYGYSSKMSVTASSFDQPLTSTFKRIFAFRSLIQTPYKTIASWAADTRKAFSRFEPVIEQIVKIPITRLVDFLGSKIQTLQMGDIRMYCFYIVFTLAVLLIVIFK